MRDGRADLGLALDVLEREALGRVPDDVAVHEPCSVGVRVRIGYARVDGGGFVVGVGSMRLRGRGIGGVLVLRGEVK
jgi:hypothetical protein